MSIIFNELEYAKSLIKNGTNKFVTLRDLIILAKYYRGEGYSESEIVDYLSNFCAKISEYANIIYGNKIELALKKSKDRTLRTPKPVPITKSEMLVIRALKNYRYEKVLFTMLVLGKYYKLTKTTSGKVSSNLYYIKNYPNEILKLAHVTAKKDENIFNFLYQAGLIDNSRVLDAYFIKFTNADDESEIDFYVSDIDKIVDFYVPICEKCGIVLEKKSKMHGFCSDCYREKRLETYRTSNRNRNKTK